MKEDRLTQAAPDPCRSPFRRLFKVKLGADRKYECEAVVKKVSTFSIDEHQRDSFLDVAASVSFAG